MENLFIRSAMLLGEDGIEKLKTQKIAVFGIGGVGSFVVEALARSGVGHIVLIDFDDIVPSNINRQIHANIETVGALKVDAMKTRIQKINPDISVTALPLLYNKETSESILTDDIDYVVDAIDMVTSKLLLIEQCKEMNIPIVCSMGTGNKLNPTMLEVADISKTSVCPLAKVMRTELKKRRIKKVKVVYSKEQPLKPAKLESSDSRRSTPGSVSFVPSVAGMILASEVIKDILEI
ncbi:MAG: tRNA threonylcarbamoyladenosine dehydratase [Clostridiales bacterium]|nr:tRNA threonylcarbamoyladenosine dehydratase [Clostridiales bacterium]